MAAIQLRVHARRTKRRSAVNHMRSLFASTFHISSPCCFYPSGISESLTAPTVFLLLLFTSCLSGFTSDAKSKVAARLRVRLPSRTGDLALTVRHRTGLCRASENDRMSHTVAVSQSRMCSRSLLGGDLATERPRTTYPHRGFNCKPLAPVDSWNYVRRLFISKRLHASARILFVEHLLMHTKHPSRSQHNAPLVIRSHGLSRPRMRNPR
jgi:hypothetical protein